MGRFFLPLQGRGSGGENAAGDADMARLLR